MREMREKLEMCRGTGKYDEQLGNLCLSTEPRPFFGVLHPELLPYVGQNYDKTGVLLVGESHYVKEAAPEQFKRTNWYHSALSLDGDYPFNSGAGAQDWFDTREVLVRYMHNDRGKGHTIFSRPETVLQELGLGTGSKYQDFDHFAFMNFFQRPSLKAGTSIAYTDEDKQAANEVFDQVVAILRPKAVVFLSKKAYRALYAEPRSNVLITAVSHPTSYWWDRKRRDGGCARQDFKNILQEVLLRSRRSGD